MALSEADSALGLLNGLGRLIQDPEVLLGPFLTREALASSRIEGTNASLSDVLKAEDVEVEPERSDDIAEVVRYLAANRLGMKLIQDLPLTERLIKQVHATLMRGVRGDEKLPGEFRRSPVWIGSAGATPTNATFVPPLHTHLPSLMTDWGRFVNEHSDVPTLVKCALAHYQFETMHPFLDGNGRMGRLLIGFMLIAENKLGRPLLYLSGYLENNRADYYATLQGVRETGDLESYLMFFLTAVRKQSQDAVARAGQLIELRQRYYKDCSLDRSRVGALIPLIFQNPFLTVKRVQDALDLTTQGARNTLAKAAGTYKWIRHIGTVGRGGRSYWLAQAVYDIIEQPVSYADVVP